MTSPDRQPTSETIAATLVALYALAEKQLLEGGTLILRRTTPDLAGRQLALGKLRRLVQGVIGRLMHRTNPLLVQMITAAVAEGAQDAQQSVSRELALHAPKGRERGAGGGSGGVPPGRDLDTTGGDEFFDLSMPHGVRAAEEIRKDITSSLEDVRFRLTRLPDDIYKMIAPHGGIYQVLPNGVTPAQAQAMAWRVFVSQGVTGFTDKSGRNWSLSAYTEMAVRTAATRAYNASHLARMHALGIEYFTLPTTPHACPYCFPWQGKVLTDGPVSDPAIHVDATIAEATAAGLFHPNCRHVLLPVFPGVTVLPEQQEWTDELANEYRLSQRQRHLELQVRKAKRQLEYAVDPETRAAAAKQVRLAQAAVLAFVRSTGFARQSRREQLNLTDDRIKLPTPIR